jgi:hypothetical protein
MRTYFSGYRFNFLAVSVFLLFLPLSLWAQNKSLPPIRLKGGSVFAQHSFITWINAYSARIDKQPQQVLLHFATLPDAAQRIQLREAGIELLQYVPQNAFVALVKPQVSVPGTSGVLVSGLTEMDPKWKVDEYLQQQKGNVAVAVSFYTIEAEGTIKAFIEKAGGKIESEVLKKLGIYRITIPVKNLEILAAWYATEYLSPAFEDKPLEIASTAAQKANLAVLPVSHGGMGLTGAGVTVGVGDNSSGIVHVDLRDRTINYNPRPYAFHGVHTSGIVAGTGIVDPKGTGMAPGSRVINQLYSAIWQQAPDYYAAHNMTITNNSYAATVGNCTYAGTYDVNSKAIDELARQYKDVLHVFAGGNDGILTCAPFPKGFAAVSGGYQPAKNNLVVSSMDRHYKNAEVTNSSGPVKDGRLKPEMCAVGEWVYAPTNTEEYFPMLGTSMASPQVAGGLALLTERYKQTHSNVNPRADLMKALMLTGSTDLGATGPDFTNGFGFMNLERSLRIMDNNQYVIDSITHGGLKTISIPVGPNTSQVKVTLCWMDAPGSPLSSVSLVNDLDLEVKFIDTYLPLVLDAAAANVQKPAVQKIDRQNNTEQIIINNPTTGLYTITVKGFNVPSMIQDYVLTYDQLLTTICITSPVTGESMKSGDSAHIYWEAPFDNTSSFTLQYQSGANWITIDNNIAADKRSYLWTVPSGPAIGSFMRLIKNSTSETFTSGNFLITPQPGLKLDSIQCPGYIRFSWDASPGAPVYEVLQKVGPSMQPVDTVTGTSCTLAGLSLDSTYYVAVKAWGTIYGYRSLAIKRRPDNGTCIGNISDGDLMIRRIESPVNGRAFTGKALTNNEQLKLVMRNLDDAPCNSYKISYSINGGTWQVQSFTNTLAPNSESTVTVTGIDLSAIGSYTIRAAIENLSAVDPVRKNDTITKTVHHLQNNPVNLASTFSEDFEAVGAFTSGIDSFGIAADRRWDYENSNDTGQIRSFVNPGITVNGNRSISLDAIQNMARVINTLTGTFSLGNYNANTDEVRLEFNYIVHGTPKFKDENKVSVRGADNESLQSLIPYNTDLFTIGKVQHSGSLSLTDALRNNGQNFSTSTQVQFRQEDTSVISLRHYGNGLTFDDVKLYTVLNDMQLSYVANPLKVECGLTGMVPLTVKVYNSVFNTQNNVQLYYQLDGGSVVHETLGSIAGKDSVIYTFSQKMDLSQQGKHVLNIWLSATGDTYLKNDSIMNYVFHNQPLVAVYPHKEDFEQNDGYWYTEGLQSSWQYGTPASKRINKAASGSKAWKTNLSGNYNNLETSYLYSPCFNISSLFNPWIRFKTAFEIEDCKEELCDVAYMEYSTDGASWNRLNASNRKHGWYNDSAHQAWTGEQIDWHEASSALPKGAASLRLRFVFLSDIAVTLEGMAIDDIEVFDKNIPSRVVTVYPNPTRDGKIFIDWTANIGVNMQVSITDIAGRVIYQTSDIATDDNNRTTIQTARFSSGVYFMRMHIGTERFAHKIVFQ